MTKVAITGGHGFLGWHLACRLRALRGVEPIRLGRQEFQDPTRLKDCLDGVETVYHLAGVNRASEEGTVERGNSDLAGTLAQALRGRQAHVVFANTIHATTDTPYGRGKSRAAEVLSELDGTLADIRLPNLFGEYARPMYNSFVATFCHEIVNGREPTVHEDRPIRLMHAQDAAQVLMVAAERAASQTSDPPASSYVISDVAKLIGHFHKFYGESGDIPDVSTSFARDLFNTYRSHLFDHRPSIHPPVHADDRGVLLEAVRSHGGTGQAYISTTLPGAKRGEHYHLRKFERFLVVKGEAEIKLRRLLHGDVKTFRVSGARPAIIDMPTLWVHNLRNIGEYDLVTMFWSDQLLDREQPDQFAEEVEVAS